MRIGHGHVNSCLVFTLNCDRIRFGNLNALFHPCIGFADGAFALLLSHALPGVVDGLGCRFLTKCDNIARFISDVRHVDVDQTQTDLF